MTQTRPLPLLLCALAALGWILPPAALAGDRIGTPYRGPEELTTGGGAGDTDSEGIDTGAPPDDSGGTDEGADPNAGVPSAGGVDRGKVAKLDGNIVWQWYWEHNKDRYLARSTERGRVAAGSAYYWFGAGSKAPPRQIDPVSPAMRAEQIFPLLRSRLKDPDAQVRAEACISLGRLGNVPAPPDQRADGRPDNLVARELIAILNDTANQANHGLVHQSAVLAVGISKDEAACAWLLGNLDKLSADEKGYAYVGFGLARYAPAIPTLLAELPRSSRGRATTDDNLAALHALGLYGPEFVDEINKDNRNGVKEIERLVDTRGDAAVVSQAIATLARLQVEQRTVEKAFSAKTNEIQWTSLLALANYSANEDMAGDAAKALMTRGWKSGKGQSKNFTLLSLGEMAGRLDPNSRTRAAILKFLKDEGLDTKDNYVRSSAALALAMANDPTAVPAIADLLQDTTVDDQVVAAASLALGLLRATEYADLIQREVLDKKSWKPDARGYGLLGLALMGDTTRMPDIMKVVNSRPPKETERQMSLAVGVLGEQESVRPLVGFFSSEWKTNKTYLASNAAYGLGWMRDQSAVAELAKLINSPHAMVRAMACVALGYVGASDRVSPVARCYENLSYRNDFGGWDLLVALANIL